MMVRDNNDNYRIHMNVESWHITRKSFTNRTNGIKALIVHTHRPRTTRINNWDRQTGKTQLQ
jgi:hypothetical protein